MTKNKKSPERFFKISQLNRFKDHKYVSEGVSICEPIMQIFWNKVVLYVPDFVAPNVLTILGFAVNLCATVLIVFFSPDSKRMIPSWALFFSSLSVFFYQTMDAIDGKQARKIKLSTPLGELFDHGCDSLSTMLLCIINSSAMSLGSYPNILFFSHIFSHIMFYSFQWKTYVIGKMSFTKISVTEIQFGIMIISTISAIFGTDIYLIPIIGGINFVYIYFGIFVISTILTLFSVFYSIKDGGPGKNGTTVAGTSIISPVIPVIICSTLFTLIHNHLFSKNLYDNYSIILNILIGCTFAKLNINILVSYMTRDALKLLDRILLAPVILWLVIYFQFNNFEVLTLYSVTIYCLCNVFIHFYSICFEISEFLKLPIFSVPHSV